MKVLIIGAPLETLLSLVKHYEGLHDGDLHTIGLQPKMCPAGYWTEGFGIVITDSKGKMLRGAENKALAYQFSKIKTEQQAIEALLPALAAREWFINKLNLPINDFQKAALISLCYNIGSGNFLKSSLLKAIRSGATKSEIDIDFRKWNKAGGVILPGLDKRRTCESYLYLINQLKFF
jgi:lysozyme